jgi:hypothetical protein
MAKWDLSPHRPTRRDTIKVVIVPSNNKNSLLLKHQSPVSSSTRSITLSMRKEWSTASSSDRSLLSPIRRKTIKKLDIIPTKEEMLKWEYQVPDLSPFRPIRRETIVPSNTDMLEQPSSSSLSMGQEWSTCSSSDRSLVRPIRRETIKLDIVPSSQDMLGLEDQVPIKPARRSTIVEQRPSLASTSAAPQDRSMYTI